MVPHRYFIFVTSFLLHPSIQKQLMVYHHFIHTVYTHYNIQPNYCPKFSSCLTCLPIPSDTKNATCCLVLCRKCISVVSRNLNSEQPPTPTPPPAYYSKVVFQTAETKKNSKCMLLYLLYNFNWYNIIALLPVMPTTNTI